MKKMKKVLFLMSLLFLLVLGTEGVKAQVRIGGNIPPNTAAVLDLNTSDAATGTKGLALPRVNLTSYSMQLTSGVANLNGMLVYNTSLGTSLGSGVYYWSGSSWVNVANPVRDRGTWATLSLKSTPLLLSLELVLDTIITTPDTLSTGFLRINVNGLTGPELCFVSGLNSSPLQVYVYPNQIEVWDSFGTGIAATQAIRFRCLR
jgi:hypothetical protein